MEPIAVLSGLIGIIITATVTAYLSRRSSSGRIDTSEAKDLWDAMRRELDRVHTEASGLREELSRVYKETTELHEALINVREEIATARQDIVKLTEELKIAREAMESKE